MIVILKTLGAKAAGALRRTVWNHQSSIPQISYKEVLRTESIVHGAFAIATKRGLFILDNGSLFRVLRGHYYGLTLSENSMYVFQKLNDRVGRILRIGLEPGVRDCCEVEPYLDDLSPGCHQIDVFDGDLYVVDTYNNRILQVGLEDRSRKEFYPKGVLQSGRQSPNYAHMNSILLVDDEIYVFCHNETQKTGRKSSILRLAKDFSVIEESITTGGNGHNIVKYGDDIFYCDSMGMSVKKNEDTIFKTDLFTRGFSLTDDYLVVGGSEYAKRKDRGKAKGALYFLDWGYQELFSIAIPGMVQEIRRIDGPDYSFSNQQPGL